MKQVEFSLIAEWCEKRNIFIDYHSAGEGNEKDVVIADWNNFPKAMAAYIENFWEIDWEDESDYCQDCYKHIHTTNYGYPKFINTEYGAVCRTCVLKESETYLEEFTFWADAMPVYPKAVPSWLLVKLEENGYAPFYSENSACKDGFECGLHAGQNDTPEKVAKHVFNELGSVEMLFCIDDANMFEVRFSAYIKKPVHTV